MPKEIKIGDIEEKAKRIIDGEIEPYELQSLPILDRLLTEQLANLYQLTKSGALSAKSAALLKYNYLTDYRGYQTELIFVESMHSEWLERSRAASDLLTQLAKKLSGKDDKQDDVLDIALSIIDKLTNQNVYLELYHMYCTDKMSKTHAIQAGSKIVDVLIERYGNKIPYAQQLEAFYRVVNKGKLAEMWEQLDPDTFRQRARHVPLKDEKSEGYCQSLKTIYKKGR